MSHTPTQPPDALPDVLSDADRPGCPELRALLGAVLEAIAIPHPATVGDEEAHARVLVDRAMHARIALENVLERDDAPGWSADYLRARLAEHPPTGYQSAGSAA